MITGVNHLAFMTNDMDATIRFYRDLLGMELRVGIGEPGWRHYFFGVGADHIAFFEFDGATPMVKRAHGALTTEPLGFDHVALNVATRNDLFALRDRLVAAGVEPSDAVDHGWAWSVYFHDPNNIALEITWDCVEVSEMPAIDDPELAPAAREGAAPQPGMWPVVSATTPPHQRVARPGGGYGWRERFLREGKARAKPGVETPGLADRAAE
jgi:catechol 2,3-dioxygenase-like lactoylglutathione lyase family enzyme